MTKILCPVSLSALILSASLGLSACVPDTAKTDTAASSKSVTVETDPFDQAAMDALLSEAVADGDVIGVSALVYDEGEVVYTGAFGLADRERERAVDMDTVWRIYSMTKPIMSALIMDLAEDDLLSIDDPVSDYIPEVANMQVVSRNEAGEVVYTPQARAMTIEDLLLHRAGLAYGIFGGNPVEEAYQGANLFQPDEPLVEKMARLAQLPLIAQPGEVWSYSYSIDVLGRIAEIVTDTPLDALMKERFFDPLGMNETGFQVRSDQQPRFASTYMLQPDGSFVLAEDGQGSPFTQDVAFFSGGGGLVSTLGDYAKFAEMISNDGAYAGQQILEPETVHLMTSDHMGTGFRSYQPWIGGETGAGFGYGGAVQLTATPEQQAAEGRYPGQWGWGGAARTNYFDDPHNDSFGIIMLQFFGGDAPQIHRDFRALVLKETRDDAKK